MFLAIVLLALGLVLGVGGAKLALLGGSFYYLVTGICLAATAVLVWLRKPLAVWVYAATTGGTMLWAIYESGLDTWALMPRVLGPVSLGLWFALPAVRYRLGTNPLGAAVNPVVFASGIALLVLSYFLRHSILLPRLKDPVATMPGMSHVRHPGRISGVMRVDNVSLKQPK